MLIPYHWLLAALAICEFRWRLAWVRVLLVVLAVAELQIAMGLGPAYRRATGQQQQVAMSASQNHLQRQPSDFMRGVGVMTIEARRVLNRANFPLAVLVWLSVYPVVLPPVLRKMKGTNAIRAKLHPEPATDVSTGLKRQQCVVDG